jgi:uncharacterized iron-regulated protein
MTFPRRGEIGLPSGYDGTGPLRPSRFLGGAVSRAALFLLLSLAAGVPAAAQPRVLGLPIGDPARRDREAPIRLDTVTDTRSGEALTPDELAARLDSVRLVVVGEEHTSAEFHRVQLTLLEALARHGRPLLVGLEMFPAREQAALDGWNSGLYTEDGFVRLGRWYEHWGYPWGYYREIFLFAQKHGIPLYALNAPREVVSAVHKKGLAGLTPEEAAHLPAKIETGGADVRILFRSYFDSGDPLHGAMGDAELDGMVASQATWDAAMAKNAVAALAAHGKPDTLMVIFAGSGHAAYGLGIERQAAAQGFAGRTAAVIRWPSRTRTASRSPRRAPPTPTFSGASPASASRAFPRPGSRSPPAATAASRRSRSPSSRKNRPPPWPASPPAISSSPWTASRCRTARPGAASWPAGRGATAWWWG